MSSEHPQTEVSHHPTTSPVLLNILADPTIRDLYPKEQVACMQCPLAVWQTEEKSLRCHCRILYKLVWETAKPGRIRSCDMPFLLAPKEED